MSLIVDMCRLPSDSAPCMSPTVVVTRPSIALALMWKVSPSRYSRKLLTVAMRCSAVRLSMATRSRLEVGDLRLHPQQVVLEASPTPAPRPGSRSEPSASSASKSTPHCRALRTSWSRLSSKLSSRRARPCVAPAGDELRRGQRLAGAGRAGDEDERLVVEAAVEHRVEPRVARGQTLGRGPVAEVDGLLRARRPGPGPA